MTAATVCCLSSGARAVRAQTVQEAIDAVQPRVVKIFGAGGIANLHAYGTGFLVSPEGHVVTVWSHVLDGDVVNVVLSDGRRYYAKVLGAEPQLDLAVLKIDAEDLPCFDLSKAATAGPGVRVLGFTNMYKVATGDEPVSVLHGVISARTNLTARRGRFEVPYNGPVYVVDAITNNPGSAGGVLTTYDGRLLGMLGRELRNAESNIWINYVIPIQELRSTIEAIRTGDFSARDNPPPENSGGQYTALDFGIVLVPDVIYRTPAYIDGVVPGSLADGVDLRPDDLIVFVNNELVQSIRTLQGQFARLQAEDDLTLIVRRGKQLVSATMRVRGRNDVMVRFRKRGSMTTLDRKGHSAVLLVAALCCVLETQSTSAVAQVSGLEEQAFQQAAALVDPSIVRIETIGGLDIVGNILTGTGPTTGVVVSEDGYIITSSFNFLSKPASVLVTLGDGRRFPAELVSSDRSRMLTLIRIEQNGMTPIAAAPKGDVQVGQWAIALGRTYDNTFPSVSVGIVSALGRIWGRAVQTDAKVSPVNYGGPLVDLEGRAIGILVPLSPQGGGEAAGVEWYDGGIGFAIPMDDVRAVLDRLKSGEELKPGLMGVSFEAMGPLAGAARIDRVRPLSPADEAGLEVDDVIVEADGKPVERVPALQHILGAKYAGDPLALTVKRGEETRSLTLKLVAELVPYESAFLGILPVRSPVGAQSQGVEVRDVLAESPAQAAGLARRDVITAIGDQPATDAAALLDKVSRLPLGQPTTVTVLRDGKSQTLAITPGAIPETVPADVPTANIPAWTPPEGTAAPRTGRFNDKLPGGEQEFWAYVPEHYNPEYSYALVLWLHPAGDTMEASLMRQWQSHCDRRGIILVGPKAADISGWTPGEMDFVRGVVEQMQGRYSIDRQRVVVHGHGASGQFAFDVGFKHRDLFRGLVVGSAPLRTPPPDNDPDFRQQLYLVCGDKDPLIPAVKQTAEGLRKLKFPVSFATLPDVGEQYPGDEAVEQIVRWIDALDRI